ncbi:hypothetical protein BDN72DRAFT_301149 [Pluteus cervinus]|uniref:Uncharacterized protein n=1 Tax=Pluteus cervinus TaxID=181527 RepID=A0ACD3AEK9_9AGAR|nr:hypothetical protein BDN72DRAFT_301149 [Pluteus cervinus]
MWLGLTIWKQAKVPFSLQSTLTFPADLPPHTLCVRILLTSRLRQTTLYMTHGSSDSESLDLHADSKVGPWKNCSPVLCEIRGCQRFEGCCINPLQRRPRRKYTSMLDGLFKLEELPSQELNAMLRRRRTSPPARSRPNSWQRSYLWRYDLS